MLFYIWKQLFIPLSNCTVVKLNYPASAPLFKQAFVHYSGKCFSFHRIIASQYLAFATICSVSKESIISYHKQRRKHEILVCNTELDTKEVSAEM